MNYLEKIVSKAFYKNSSYEKMNYISVKPKKNSVLALLDYKVNIVR